MHIFVGSLNPVKINAVIQAASETWPDVQVTGLSVPSGINEQPLSDAETKQGATNRAEAAIEDGLKQLNSNGTVDEEILAVGLEGGVFKNEQQELWSTVWAVVTDLDGNQFASNGARFQVPEEIAQPILAGGEMGPVVSRMFDGADIRRKQGAIGVITDGFIDRTEEYTSIAKMAIGLWYGRNWSTKLKQKS